MEIRKTETPSRELLLLADEVEASVADYIGRGTCYAACDDGRIVGQYVLIHTRPFTAEVVNIAVVPDRQRQGIATALLAHAVDTARRAGFRLLEIGTGNSGFGQIALYERCGCTAPQKLDTFGVFFMKYNYEIRLKAVKLVLEGGLSVREAGCHLGCGRSQVHLWVTLFERHGLAGLKLRHGSYSAEFKLSVLKHMHQNHLSLLETAVHFGIPGPFVIRQWERLYQNQGAEGLRRKPQRRRPAMSKSKTKKVKLKTTPHEELLKELEYLRAENAYLKKLQALVEERIVRESGKEPKPSKD